MSKLNENIILCNFICLYGQIWLANTSPVNSICRHQISNWCCEIFKYKAVTIIEASEAIASLKIPSIFLNKWFTKVSCVSFYVDFVEVVSRCSNRIIVSLFRMLLYVGVHSASNRTHPSFSCIMSLRDVAIHVTCLQWRHFLYEMDIWLKTGSCRKRKAGRSKLGLCKLYVAICHTQIST